MIAVSIEKQVEDFPFTHVHRSEKAGIGTLLLPVDAIDSLGAATSMLRELGLLDLQWGGEQLPATPAPDGVVVKAAKLVRLMLKPKQ